MKSNYTNITVYKLSPSLHKIKRTDYIYIVEASTNGYYGSPLTAFRTKEGLKNWMKRRDLKITGRKGNSIFLTSYSRLVLWDFEEFQSIKKQNPRFHLATENGSKTIGLFLNGIEYVMNPNTDVFVKDSLIQSYIYKANEERKKKLYSMYHH